MFDLVIIGAGPAGISAAYEAKKAGLVYLVIEKGLIGNTVYNYPRRAHRFFDDQRT